MADDALGRHETGDGSRLLLRFSQHADPNARLSKVRRHPHRRDAHEPDARILEIAADDGHDLFAHLLADLIGAVAGHDDLRCQQDTPCLDFFPLEAVRLHHVAGFECLEAFEPDATLLAGRHFAHILFEVLQRVDPAFEDLLLPPKQLDPTATADLALDDAAARDDTEARNLDRSDDLDPALADLAVRRFAQTFGRAFDVLS